MRTPSSPGGADRVVALLLFGVTVLYLIALPHNLGVVDESTLLYESVRIANGEVPYRDFFEIITPLSYYVLACAFRLFGTDIGTARAVAAVTHGVTVVAMYASARLLGVRHGISAVTALAFIAFCHPTWPYVSAHWLSTAVVAVLSWQALAARWADQPSRALRLGFLTGVIVVNQQQKGAVLIVGMVTLFVLDGLIGRPFMPRERWRMTVDRIAMLLAGVVVIAAPALGVLVFLAGPGPMIEALIAFPLTNYRHGNAPIAWGGNVMMASHYATYTVPAILRYMPVAYAFVVARALALWARRNERAELRRLTVLVVLGAFSALSVLYRLDLIHLAFIAPPFFIAGAAACEWAARRLPPPLSTIAVIAVCLIAGAGTTWQLQRGMARSWREFPVPYASAFGRIDLRDDEDIPVYDAVREWLPATPTREIFAYPSLTAPYLFTGAKNPTRFQYFSTQQHTAEHAQEIISVLDARQVQYVVLLWFFIAQDDPIRTYVQQHYEHVNLGGVSRLLLFRRKPEQVP